jgi:hypothetical protein
VKVVGFEDDPELLERFAGLEARLYRDDPYWPRLPRRDVRLLLRPDAPFHRRGGRVRSFLALGSGEEPSGRATAMVAPWLRGPDGRPLGLIGLWECADEPAAARNLLDAALGWLRGGGVARVLGPLDFSTWHRYRFVTEGHARGPFLLDTYHHPWYAAQFQAAGFTPFRTYATLRAPHTPVSPLARAHARALAAGVRFESAEAVELGTLLRLVYELSRRLFAGKTAYSEIEWEEYRGLYAGVEALLVPGLSWLARDVEGRAVGFLFGYPDSLEPVRRGAPGARPETTVLKTLAVDPGAVPGLGWALVHLHAEHARARGYREGLYALMEKWQPLLRFARHTRRMLGGPTGEVWKRYALFERSL